MDSHPVSLVSGGQASDHIEPLLTVSDLRTEFITHRGIVRAVNGVSLTVGRGRVVGIVGESGGGKTAAIRSILGLIRPPGRVVGGRVEFEGRSLLGLSDRKFAPIRGAHLSYVPQDPLGALSPLLRIERQFLNIIRAHRKVSRREAVTMAEAMLDRVGIRDPVRVLKGYAHELSGGMAQRVVLGLAQVLSPELVVADEPTTGLDVTVQREVLDAIRYVCEADGRAMVVVTHDLGVVAQYCDEVIVMYAGRVVEEGPARTVLVDPAHPYTKALVAAIPEFGTDLHPLSGRVPDLIDYPIGCAFAARCPQVMPICREVPVTVNVSSDHSVACHLYE